MDDDRLRACPRCRAAASNELVWATVGVADAILNPPPFPTKRVFWIAAAVRRRFIQAVREYALRAPDWDWKADPDLLRLHGLCRAMEPVSSPWKYDPNDPPIPAEFLHYGRYATPCVGPHEVCLRCDLVVPPGHACTFCDRRDRIVPCNGNCVACNGHERRPS
jgi:hypothetical protein